MLALSCGYMLHPKLMSSKGRLWSSRGNGHGGRSAQTSTLTPLDEQLLKNRPRQAVRTLTFYDRALPTRVLPWLPVSLIVSQDKYPVIFFLDKVACFSLQLRLASVRY